MFESAAVVAGFFVLSVAGEFATACLLPTVVHFLIAVIAEGFELVVYAVVAFP